MQRTKNVKIIEQNTVRQLILPSFHTQSKTRVVTREHYWREGEHGTVPQDTRVSMVSAPQDARVSMTLVP